MNITEQATSLGLEKNEYLELLDIFIESTDSDLTKLEDAVDFGRLKEAIQLAHHIKGAACNLNLEIMIESVTNIEGKVRNGKLGESKELIQSLKGQLSVLRETASKSLQ